MLHGHPAIHEARAKTTPKPVNAKQISDKTIPPENEIVSIGGINTSFVAFLVTFIAATIFP
jgi:hypothetical protein